MRGRVLRGLRRTGIMLVAVVLVVLALAGLYLAWDDLAPVHVAVAVPGFTVDAAGVATHVERWPAAHPSGLPPLVLVPGFAESTYVFSRLATRLAADRDVYAYDVRGYGYSAHQEPYTLESDTDQLAGVIAALHLTRPIVVGHSLGAAIALSLALRDPGAVTGVVAANGDGTPYFGTTARPRAAAGEACARSWRCRRWAPPWSPRSSATATRSGTWWPRSAARAARSTTAPSTAGALRSSLPAASARSSRSAGSPSSGSPTTRNGKSASRPR